MVAIPEAPHGVPVDHPLRNNEGIKRGLESFFRNHFGAWQAGTLRRSGLTVFPLLIPSSYLE